MISLRHSPASKVLDQTECSSPDVKEVPIGPIRTGKSRKDNHVSSRGGSYAACVLCSWLSSSFLIHLLGFQDFLIDGYRDWGMLRRQLGKS